MLLAGAAVLGPLDAPDDPVEPASEAAPVLARPSGGPVATLALVPASPGDAASAVDVAQADCPAPWRAMAGQSASALETRVDSLRRDSVARAATALSSAADPFERAVGRLLSERVANGGALDAAGLAWLAGEATQSGDARLAAMAVLACEGAEPSDRAACEGFEVLAWARADQANLHPWLTLAAQAMRRGDDVVVQLAMRMAAASVHARTPLQDLRAVLAGDTLRHISPMDRDLLAAELANASGIYSMPGLLDLPLLCEADALRSRSRRDQCRAIAGTLVGHGRTPIELGVAFAIARSAGWQPERLDALERAYLAEQIRATHAQPFPEPQNAERLTLDEICKVHRALRALAQVAYRHEPVSAAAPAAR